MPGVSGVTVVTSSRAFYFCTQGCGRVERPAFPAALCILERAKSLQQTSGASRGENREAVFTSLRAANELQLKANFCRPREGGDPNPRRSWMRQGRATKSLEIIRNMDRTAYAVPAFAGTTSRLPKPYSSSAFLPPMVFSLANTASTLRSSRCFSVGSNSGSLRVVSEAGSRVAPP